MMKYDIVQRTRQFDGFVKLDQLTLQYQRFDGTVTPLIEREVVCRRPAVAAVLYDPDAQSLVFVEQFRVGAKAWLMELVAGVVEPQDEPQATIEREVYEETGLEVLAIMPVTEFYSSPGFLDEYVNLFCARVNSRQASRLGGVEGEHEDIRVHVLPIESVREQLSQGVFNNAFTLIGLNWFFLNRDAIDAVFIR